MYLIDNIGPILLIMYMLYKNAQLWGVISRNTPVTCEEKQHHAEHITIAVFTNIIGIFSIMMFMLIKIHPYIYCESLFYFAQMVLALPYLCIAWFTSHIKHEEGGYLNYYGRKPIDTRRYNDEDCPYIEHGCPKK